MHEEVLILDPRSEYVRPRVLSMVDMGRQTGREESHKEEPRYADDELVAVTEHRGRGDGFAVEGYIEPNIDIVKPRRGTMVDMSRTTGREVHTIDEQDIDIVVP